MKKPFTLLVLSLTLTTTLFAAEISGTIVDSSTKEPIIGATIIVQDSGKGVSTNIDGEFRIANLRDGNYNLEVEYLGYKSLVFTASAGTDLGSIGLETDNLSIDLIEVSARQRKDTEVAMVTTVKNMHQIASGISAVQISRSPDRNASEVVKRIPGITIIDDRFIIVRGLAQRYNNTWINGLAVPSTETDGRAFSYDLIPGSQIDNLVVYKSPSPEIPADFAGGFVQITTKGVPDDNYTEISIASGFNIPTQFRDFNINPGSKTDFLGFDISKRPLSNDMPSHLKGETSPDRITHFTLNGFNNDWSIATRTPLPDIRLSFAMGRRFTTAKRRTVGNITSLNYSNTNRSVPGIENARYDIYDADNDKSKFSDRYTDNQYTNDVRLGLLHNWTIEYNSKNRIEFKNIVNILGRNRFTERSGIRDVSNLTYIEQTEMLYSSRTTYSGQFSGRHELNSPSSNINWNAGYSFADKSEPDRRIVSNLAGISNADDIQSVTTSNDNIKRYFSSLKDHIVSGSADYTKTFTSGTFNPTIKAGVYGEYRSRRFNNREFMYRYDNLSVADREVYLTLPFYDMMADKYLGADKVYIDEITNKTNDYSATIHYQALYAAIDIPLGRLNIYGGLRVENHIMDLTRDKSKSPSYTIYETNRYGGIDLIPSINATYKLNSKNQLRAAYGRSVNRPEMREVSPAVYYDFDLFSEIGGNEDLRTCYIDNAEMRYEYYPSSGEILSVGVFYKHFKNPIEWTFMDMGGMYRHNYENARAANNMGVEIDIRKNFSFIGVPDLSLVVNAAYIYSRVKFYENTLNAQPDRAMQGQSPYVVNAGLFYNWERVGFSASILYNRIGKRIIGIGKIYSSTGEAINSTIPDSYEMPRNTLDLALSKSIGKWLKVSVTVKDILSEDVVYKQFPKFEKDGKTYNREQVTKRYNPGQSVTFGISARF